MSNKNIVYVLKDPRFATNKESVRYVGKTQQGISRFHQHMSTKSLNKNTHKDNWIKQLLGLNLKPIFQIVETHETPDSLYNAEIKWYNFYKEMGCNLTNLTVCGKGTHGYKHKEITIERLKEKALVRDKTPYQNPHNKKKNFESNGVVYRNCIKCGLDKEINLFSWHETKKKFQSYCKDCHTLYQREWKEKNPSPILPVDQYNASRLPGAIAGGETSKTPERRKQTSEMRSKAIVATHTITGETLNFASALKAKEAGFQNTNIGQAIKYNKPYRGYSWKFGIWVSFMTNH